MKPLEILSALPAFAKAQPDAILDSPAFAMPCRLGEETVTVRHAPIEPAQADMLALSVTFSDEPHALCIARSPRFPELCKIWETMADVPEPILLALVERECGQFLQMLENAVRMQLRLVGISREANGGQVALCASGATASDDGEGSGDIVFTLSRSASVTAAFGALRNLDLSHEAIRSLSLPCECEYAAVALNDADLASLEPGDAVLLPEILEIAPKLVAGNIFTIDENGVSPCVADALAHVRDAAVREISLGDVFDAAAGKALKVEGLKVEGSSALGNPPLRLMSNDKTIASGRLDLIGGQPALIIG